MSDIYNACGDAMAALRMHKERLRKGLVKERGAVALTMDKTAKHMCSMYGRYHLRSYLPHVL